MEMTSSVVIDRPPAQVWAFLGDPANVSLWDRGVAGVERTSSSPLGVGSQFDTLAHQKFNLPDSGRMSYRISEADPAAGRCVVELTSRAGNARFFKSAQWHFQVQAIPQGSHLTCSAVFTLRWQYCFLGPLLWLNRKAILIDLNLLKASIEEPQARPDS
jgi:hypothetical protein